MVSFDSRRTNQKIIRFAQSFYLDLKDVVDCLIVCKQINCINIAKRNGRLKIALQQLCGNKELASAVVFVVTKSATEISEDIVDRVVNRAPSRSPCSTARPVGWRSLYHARSMPMKVVVVILFSP